MSGTFSGRPQLGGLGEQHDPETAEALPSDLRAAIVVGRPIRR